MKIKREDTGKIETLIKDAMSANRIMKGYDTHAFDNNPVMVDLCANCKRVFPEMFPALGLLYTVVTGNLFGYHSEDGTYQAVKVPRSFLTNVLMDTYYGEMFMWKRWYDDHDYANEANWSQTMYIARCDKRIIDPSRQYGFYVSCMYGRSGIVGMMLHMHGGDKMMQSSILSDLYTIADSFYSDDLVRQDVKKFLSDSMNKWLRHEPTINAIQLKDAIPDMIPYIEKANAETAVNS